MKCQQCGSGISRLKQALLEQAANGSIHLYDVDGQNIFPVYGPDGSLTTKSIFYLCEESEDPGKYTVLGCWYTNNDWDDIRKALIQWYDNKAKTIDIKNGEFGLP
jgi:hypothetical protein